MVFHPDECIPNCGQVVLGVTDRLAEWCVPIGLPLSSRQCRDNHGKGLLATQVLLICFPSLDLVQHDTCRCSAHNALQRAMWQFAQISVVVGLARMPQVQRPSHC